MPRELDTVQPQRYDGIPQGRFQISFIRLSPLYEGEGLSFPGQLRAPYTDFPSIPRPIRKLTNRRSGYPHLPGNRTRRPSGR